MVEAARAKAAAAGVPVDFSVGDAAEPPVERASQDVVVARLLLLIEGRWSTGAGIPADECAGLVRGHGREAVVRELPEPDLWGGVIDDDRYLIISRQ